MGLGGLILQARVQLETRMSEINTLVGLLKQHAKIDGSHKTTVQV